MPAGKSDRSNQAALQAGAGCAYHRYPSSARHLPDTAHPGRSQFILPLRGSECVFLRCTSVFSIEYSPGFCIYLEYPPNLSFFCGLALTFSRNSHIISIFSCGNCVAYPGVCGVFLFREAQNNSARAGGERFFPSRRFRKRWNPVWISRFWNRADGGKSSAAQPQTNCSEVP